MADLSSLKDLAPAQDAAPTHVRKVDAQGRSYATGKRKNAVARVWVKPGSGKITINGKEFGHYFARPVLQMILRQPVVAGIVDFQAIVRRACRLDGAQADETADAVVGVDDDVAGRQ